MINFRKVTLDDKSKIQDIICKSGCHGADYNFTNIYLWRDIYRPLISFYGDRLLVTFPYDNFLYSYPKGAGDVKSVIELLKNDAHSHGAKLVIRGLTEKTLEEFLPLYESEFTIEEDRNNADYIYSAEKLTSLSGRKLSSKRNHIKHFERNGKWKLEKLNEANIDKAKSFLEIFYQKKDDADLESEKIAINEMFKNYETLEFLGALLYQNEKPVAFSAGTLLDEITMDVHFEKALYSITGAYTMINREFARLACDTYKSIEFFNREEDMGIPGLRRAKESYQPDILLMKYTAYEK